MKPEGTETIVIDSDWYLGYIDLAAALSGSIALCIVHPTIMARGRDRARPSGCPGRMGAPEPRGKGASRRPVLKTSSDNSGNSGNSTMAQSMGGRSLKTHKTVGRGRRECRIPVPLPAVQAPPLAAFAGRSRAIPIRSAVQPVKTAVQSR